MANKTTTKTKKTAKNTANSKQKTARKASATKKADKTVTEATSNRSLLQRIVDMRTERAKRKAEIKRHKQTDEARKVKAENRAIREKALEQVNEAVIQSKRRKSRPALTLFFALVLSGLGGLAIYQYRQIELDDKQTQINTLQSKISGFSAEQAAIQAAKQAELAKFEQVTVGDDRTITLPADWEEKPTQFPGEEQVFGDTNVTMRVINSSSRNSIEQFIPVVDYIWTVQESPNGLKVATKSLHCQRFDTFGNDLKNTQREHQGFTVYCDTDSEKTIIAVLSTPEKYGTSTSNTYFLIEVADMQQVDFNDLEKYIESFRN